ncbi:hypothetical protein [Flavobacterium poyangense]|uniref:hypothetical protein n=1 Tax=Flavobacterium poyangense TaxID=2204302 RepID=UPI001420A1B0|nr:hypothetical protein [Flavobacterium sp. JXAS1]
MSSRRHFIKNSSIVLGSVAFLPDIMLFNLKNFSEDTIKNQSKDKVFDIMFGDPILIVHGENDILIQAYSYTVKNGFLKNFKKNIHILCHELIIEDDIEVLDGRNISIFCYSIKAVRDTIIVSRGKSGENVAKAPNAQQIGQHGEAGNNEIDTTRKVFVDGGDAGKVSLTYSVATSANKIKLYSLGGDGGKGEDGGDGYTGAVGVVGANAKTDGQPQAGGVGQKGGNGGNGASGGAGGKGNDINITRYYLDYVEQDPIIHDFVEILSIGGKGGAGGKGGIGGTGGAGGAGGKYGSWRGSGGGPHGSGSESWRLSNNRAQSGAQGSIGDTGGNGAEGVAGITGSVSQSFAVIKEISNQLTTSYTKLLLLKAESFYLNSDLAKAVELFNVVSRVNTSLLDNPVNRLYFSLCNFTFADITESDVIVNRAKVYQSQINLGLNFWARSANYVPRLRKDYLKREINQLITLAVSFESTVFKFYNQQTLADAEVQSIQQSQSSIMQGLSILKTNYQNKYNYTFYALQDEIKGLNLDIDKRVIQLERAEKRFKDALKERNKKKCGFKEVISCAQIIVSVGVAVSSFGAGIGATVGAIQTYNKLSETADTLKEQWGVVKEVGKIAKEASTSFGNAANALERVEDKIGDFFAKAKNDASLTTSLIEMEYEDFEKTINKYIDMPEARAYKAEMRQYINVINNRNKKRLEYSSSIHELDKLKSDITLVEIDLQKLSDPLIVNAAKQAPGELQLLMVNQYYSVKKQIINLLYLFTRSMEFYSLKHNEMQYFDASIATLQSNLINSTIDDIENENALSNGLNPYLNKEVIIDIKRYPLMFTDFIKGDETGHVLNFSLLPEDDLKGDFAEIRIRNVRVYLDGIRNKGNAVSMKLEHLGNSLIISRRGKKHDFCHDKVPILLDYKYDEHQDDQYDLESYRNNITGTFEDSNKKYTLVSPFANWRLSINKDVNPQVDLRRVRKVKLIFDFYATASEV